MFHFFPWLIKSHDGHFPIAWKVLLLPVEENDFTMLSKSKAHVFEIPKAPKSSIHFFVLSSKEPQGAEIWGEASFFIDVLATEGRNNMRAHNDQPLWNGND